MSKSALASTSNPMKKLFLPILLLLSGHVLAQQQEELGELRMSPRANVVTYDNENAIEHLSYTGSSPRLA